MRGPQKGGRGGQKNEETKCYQPLWQRQQKISNNLPLSQAPISLSLFVSVLLPAHVKTFNDLSLAGLFMFAHLESFEVF